MAFCLRSRYASKAAITNTYTRKVGNGMVDQHSKNVNQFYGRSENDISVSGPSETEGGSDHHQEAPQKRPSPNELPIKPRPLTIKKHSGVEPPKLKSSTSMSGLALSANRKQTEATNVGLKSATEAVTVQPQVSSSSLSYTSGGNRRVEIPPAFLFPETGNTPSGVNNSGGGDLNANLPVTTTLAANDSQDVTDHYSGKLSGQNSNSVSSALGTLSPLTYDHDNRTAETAVLSGTGVDKARANRDKRRPLVGGGGLEAQTFLDQTSNNSNVLLNNKIDVSDPIQRISLETGVDDGNGTVEQSSLMQQRQGPIGGVVEENNNVEDGMIKDEDLNDKG